MRGRFRAIGLVALLAGPILWIADGEPPPLSTWLEGLAAGLVLIALSSWPSGRIARWRHERIEHRVEVRELPPAPGSHAGPYAIAECSCGWVLDDRSRSVTLHQARKHSNTGEPRVVAGDY